MKTIYTFKPLSLLLVLLLLSSCNLSKRGDFKSGFEGLYSGVLPCADCPGISTYITFFENQDVVLTSRYEDRGNSLFTEKGIWKVNDGLLTVIIDGEDPYYYAQLSDTEIVLTDSLGEVAENLAEQSKLTKIAILTARDFNGIYSQGDLENPDAYIQTLEITPVSDGEVIVEFSSQGAGKGCSFKAEGTIVNNHIEVQMNEHHNKMTSVMVIDFKSDRVVNVYTTKEVDRFDLMYFCGGGGTLAGEYDYVED